MSLSLEKLISYLNNTKIINQSTDAPEVMSGSKKTYQTRFAFSHARTQLRTLVTKTNADEQQILRNMLEALSAIPENTSDIFGFLKLISQFQPIINGIIQSCQTWLTRTENSGNLDATEDFIHTLHFLLLTLIGDIELEKPNQNKTICWKTVINKEEKPELDSQVRALLALCRQKLNAIRPAVEEDNITREQLSQHEILMRFSQHYITSSSQTTASNILSHAQQLLPDLRQCITSFKTETTSAKRQHLYMSRLSKLANQIKTNPTIPYLLNHYRNEELFNQLMLDLRLSKTEQATWKTAFREYQWTDRISIIGYYARGPLARLGVMSESPLSFPHIQHALDQQVNHLYNKGKADTQNEIGLTTSEKLTHLKNNIEQNHQQLNTAKTSLIELEQNLSHGSYEQIRQTIASFCRFPNIFAYITSATYRSCFHQVRAIYTSYFNETNIKHLDTVNNPAEHFNLFKPLFTTLQDSASSRFFVRHVTASLAEDEYFRIECNMS